MAQQNLGSPQDPLKSPSPDDRTRALVGCILGTAVGDALGLPWEGLSPQAQRRRCPQIRHHHLILGRGLGSDDTEHTCLVAQALIQSGGEGVRFSRALGRGLRGWIAALPGGVGLATLQACVRLWLGFGPDRSGVFSAGNGPAMRSALLGVAYGDNLEQLRDLVRRSTRITHRDPQAEWGALVVALAAHLWARGYAESPGHSPPRFPGATLPHLPPELPSPLPADLPQDSSQYLPQDSSQYLPQDLSQQLPQNLPQNLPQQLTQDLSQQLTQDLSQQLTQDLSQQLTQDLPQQLTQDLSQQLTQDLSQQLTQDLPQNLPQNLSQDLPQKLTQHSTQDLSQDLSGHLTQDLSPDLSEQLTQDLPQDLSQQLTQDLSQQLTQDLSQQLTQDLSQDLSQQLTQDLPQDLSQPLTQDLPQNLSQPLTQDLSEPLTQDLRQNLSQPLTQDLSEHLTQDLSQPLTLQGLAHTPNDRPHPQSQTLAQHLENRLTLAFALETSGSDTVSSKVSYAAQERFWDLWQQLRQALRDGLTPAQWADRLGLSHGIGGYINHTWPVVIYTALWCPQDYPQAITTIIELGGDTDTTAAILGGILGAGVGVAGIPQPWLRGLVEWPRSRSWMERLGQRLGRSCQTQNPLPPEPLWWPGLILRNLLFILVIFAHGLLRILYSIHL